MDDKTYKEINIYQEKPSREKLGYNIRDLAAYHRETTLEEELHFLHIWKKNSKGLKLIPPDEVPQAKYIHKINHGNKNTKLRSELIRVDYHLHKVNHLIKT